MTFKREDIEGTQLTLNTDPDDTTVCDGCGKEIPAGVTMVGNIDSCCGGGCARSICMDCVSAVVSANHLPSMSIATEIADERLRQDTQWGGPTHDDTPHDIWDWTRYIQQQIEKLGHGLGEGQMPESADARSRLVKIAALAIAGLQSMDRRS